MHRQEIVAELQIWAVFLLMAAALVVSFSYNLRQRDKIAQQQQRIENFQYMLNSLPVDYRTPTGKKARARI